MHFIPNDDELAIQNAARLFAQRELAPYAAECDEKARLRDGIVQRLAEQGFLGIAVDESLGGVGASTVAYVLAMIEIAKGCASTAVLMSVTNMVNEIIAHFGTDAQKKKYCTQLSSGAIGPGAFALSEPEAGSDPSAMRTKAEKISGGYRINGQKQWITSGDIAGVLVLWARTSDAGQGSAHKGLSCFLVDGERVRKGDGIRVGRHENKMGLRASSTVSLMIEDLEVPDEALLAEEGKGFAIAMTALDGGRIGIASQAIGIARAAFEVSIAYTKDRHQFGTPISGFQAVQWMLADSRVELDAAELLVYRAAAKKQLTERYTKEASMAKVYSTEAAWRICNRAVQMHGGYGYTREYAVERHFRDVRVSQIYEGTSEIQRTVIARHTLS